MANYMTGAVSYWQQPMDEYCERLGHGFWAEPVNAITNISFLLAGVAILLLVKGRRLAFLRHADVYALILLTFCVGVGSFLYHTVATRWAVWADVIPIVIFINLYLLSALARLTPLTWRGVLACFLLFQAVNQGFSAYVPPHLLNGSVMYAPALMALLSLAGFLRGRNDAVARYFILACLTFLVSLTFRTLDRAVCDGFPLGTHFIWHILNGVLFYLLLKGLLAGLLARGTRAG